MSATQTFLVCFLAIYLPMMIWSLWQMKGIRRREAKLKVADALVKRMDVYINRIRNSKTQEEADRNYCEAEQLDQQLRVLLDDIRADREGTKKPTRP